MSNYMAKEIDNLAYYPEDDHVDLTIPNKAELVISVDTSQEQVLRIDHNGNIYIRGTLIENDYDVYLRLKALLSGAFHNRKF